ncbi:restriction endonuclease subunit S [Paraclostridium bifermentans]|uniref:restriction endonuclease subunit S n=1 Tax=Paraclostridium bifermentans TaxID=1490 RepID=UPI00214A6C79|nr:restriction endonuclease subunit S [Paraclostridium bifermentans]MCR1875134.1 restriction endonuclease subunit S [Paraclostridium bifermentans]
MSKVKLNEVTTIIMGQSPSSDSYNEVGDGLPFYQGKSDFGKLNPTARIYCNQPKKSAEEHDILMSVRAPVGDVNIADTTCCIGRGICAIRANEQVNYKYIYYYLKTIKYKLELMSTGSTFKAINKSVLDSIELNIPSLKEQERNVSILEKAENAIEKREESIKLLDELVKSRFIEMFGNPFDTTKWPLKKLKEVSISISDGSNVDKKYYQERGEVLFLRIQNVWCNELRLEDSVYISENVNQDYIDTSLRTGDLLITKIGRFYTKDSSLGRVSLYLGENDKANYSNNIMRVRLKDEVLSEYVNALLNLDDYNKYIRRVSVGGTDKRALSKTLIGDFPVIVPPMELQKNFIDFVKQVDKLKFEMEKSLKELKNNFNSLMQKAFNGEL